MPPGDFTYTIHVRFSTDRTVQLGNFPISIRIGSEIPQIVSGKTLRFFSLNQPLINYEEGKILCGIADGYTTLQQEHYTISPGDYEVGTVEIKVPPLSNTWRPIIIAADSMAPAQGGAYAHQCWVTTPEENPDVFKPEVRYLPCLGSMRGNINYDPEDNIDISDLTYLVGYMFKDGPTPRCFEEVDVTADISLDISDLTYMVNFMFKNGPAPKPCPLFTQ